MTLLLMEAVLASHPMPYRETYLQKLEGLPTWNRRWLYGRAALAGCQSDEGPPAVSARVGERCRRDDATPEEATLQPRRRPMRGRRGSRVGARCNLTGRLVAEFVRAARP